MKKRILSYLLAVLMVFSLNYTAIAAPKKPAAVKIISVKNISITIKQNSTYKLPVSVKVVLSNKKTMSTPVKWNVSSVKTSTPGTYTFTGKIKNYSKNVILKLIIKPLPVVIKENPPVDTPVVTPPAALTVTSIDKINTVEIKQDDKSYTLPQTVSATMSDGSKKDVDIKWNKTLDTSVLGLNKFEGSVDGYSETLKLNVIVRGLDLTPPEKITGVEAKPGDIVGVTGSLAGYTYDHFGIYIGDGKVIEYSSPTGKIPDAMVTENPMSKSFSKYFIYKLKDCKFTPEQIIERAKQTIGEKKYDLIGNNCEHFAVWCQTGVRKSFQIDAHSIADIELLDSMINSPLINIQ